MIETLLIALLVQAPGGPPVVVTVTAPELRLAPGETAEVTLVASIREGFRIQANPASQPFLVPALLELPDDERVKVGSPEYPPGTPYRLRGTSEDLSVYAGTLEIRVPLEARRTPHTGSSAEVVLEGRLRYQACNEEICLRPASAPVELRVSLTPVRARDDALTRAR